MDLDYIAANEFDDDAFVARVDVIFAGAVGNRVCDEVVVVRVDGFFDRRWFRFAGKVGAAGVHDFGDVVVPPFHPQRIVDERFITGTGPPLHVAQTSEANLRRTLRRRVARGAWLWFSSESKRDGRGSALCMVVDVGGRESCFYASFNGAKGWAPDHVVGTSLDMLERFAWLGSFVGLDDDSFVRPPQGEFETREEF